MKLIHEEKIKKYSLASYDVDGACDEDNEDDDAASSQVKFAEIREI